MSFFSQAPAKIFTVSELVHETKASLEAMFPDVWVQGEISNVNCHSSGHCYFSIKDAGAQLSAVMFRDDFRRLRFRPETGLHVVLQGRLTLYPPQGDSKWWQHKWNRRERRPSAGLRAAESEARKGRPVLIPRAKSRSPFCRNGSALSPPPMAPHCMTC